VLGCGGHSEWLFDEGPFGYILIGFKSLQFNWCLFVGVSLHLFFKK
jgi:hypothetical protein